jgi:hypothetical protein
MKNLRPMSKAMAEAAGCPDHLFAVDGESLRDLVFRPLSKLLTRPVSIINVDGEVFVSIDSPAEQYNFSADPLVLSDYHSSGAANWETYWSMWRTRLTNAVSDAFMKDEVLSQTVLKGAKFTVRGR